MSHSKSQAAYANLIRSQRIASLGTLRDGAPFVSLVPYAVTPDLTSFLIHISRLALHTQDILQEARVGLMIAEPDDAARNPQAIPRASIQGQATIVTRGSDAYQAMAELYLNKFRDSAITFSLGDFELYRIEARTARFVAGFGQIYNFGQQDFVAASAVADSGESTAID